MNAPVVIKFESRFGRPIDSHPEIEGWIGMLERERRPPEYERLRALHEVHIFVASRFGIRRVLYSDPLLRLTADGVHGKHHSWKHLPWGNIVRLDLLKSPTLQRTVDLYWAVVQTKHRREERIGLNDLAADPNVVFRMLKAMSRTSQVGTLDELSRFEQAGTDTTGKPPADFLRRLEKR